MSLLTQTKPKPQTKPTQRAPVDPYEAARTNCSAAREALKLHDANAEALRFADMHWGQSPHDIRRKNARVPVAMVDAGIKAGRDHRFHDELLASIQKSDRGRESLVEVFCAASAAFKVETDRRNKTLCVEAATAGRDVGDGVARSFMALMDGLAQNRDARRRLLDQGASLDMVDLLLTLLSIGLSLGFLDEQSSPATAYRKRLHRLGFLT